MSSNDKVSFNSVTYDANFSILIDILIDRVECKKGKKWLTL